MRLVAPTIATQQTATLATARFCFRLAFRILWRIRFIATAIATATASVAAITAFRFLIGTGIFFGFTKGFTRYLLVGQLLDRFDIFGIIARRQSKGSTFAARATGSANAMHIVFGMGRYIEVKHMADGRNIKAPRRHIRSNQIGRFSGFESVEHFQAHMLVHITVQRYGFVVMTVQAFQKLANIAFSVAENNPVCHVLSVKQ